MSVFLALKLELRTDFAELLPDGDPSVRELRRVQSKLPDFGALIVNIRSPDREANIRFADDLSAEVRKLPKSVVSLAVSNIKAERGWFEEHKWLYESLLDLEKLRDRLSTEIEKAKNPLFIELDDGVETLDQMKARLEKKRDSGVLAHDHFVTKNGKTAMVVILPAGGLFRENAGERLVAAVTEIVRKLRPETYGQLEIGYSGDVESLIEERQALEKDLVWASSICILLVCLSVGLYYRSVRAIPLMATPAFIGAMVAFGVAYLRFGYLNSSTAFLGSIIVGNGVNFAIIQLARYEEERHLGVVPAVALVRAVAATVRATAVASLATSIAYASLVLTRFQGFSQFGLIGGVGMVAAWLATITVLPSLLWLLDRKKSRIDAPPPAGRGTAILDAIARLPTTRPRALILVGAGITAGALILLPEYLKDPFEYNFENLRSLKTQSEHGEGRFFEANSEVFKKFLSPLVVLTERSDQVESAREALREQDRRGEGGAMLDHVMSIEDLLPGSPSIQSKKQVMLREIRGLMTDPSFKLLDDDERERLLKYMPPERVEQVRLTDLPALLRYPFTEVDGRTGRVLLLFPKEAVYQPWNGRDLIRLSERVAEIKLSRGETVRAVGSAVIFAGMIRSIVHDGPVATLFSAIGVMILVIALARGLGGAALVLGTLGAGLLWMIGIAAALSQRVNFLNFVTLPITIGIGVDYGINIYLRYRLEGPGRLLSALRATGGAVALCSLTAIIGYGALLVADNRGLRSYGTMAIVGEFSCLTAALIFMPALLALRERRMSLVRHLEAEAVASALTGAIAEYDGFALAAGEQEKAQAKAGQKGGDSPPVAQPKTDDAPQG